MHSSDDEEEIENFRKVLEGYRTSEVLFVPNLSTGWLKALSKVTTLSN